MNKLFKTEDENVKTFFEKTGLDINEVTSKCRKEHLVYKRMALYKYLRNKGYTLSKIGRIINRGHDVVYYYESNFEANLKYNKPFREIYEDIDNKIKTNT